MSIEVFKTKLKNVLLIKSSIFEDFRGYFVETYNKQEYKEKGINIDFVQDNISISSRHVLRGIHGDSKTWKLISCLKGRIYVVVVDCNEESNNFGKWQSFILSNTNKYLILVPPMYGLSHLILTNNAILSYKQSTYYGSTKQFTYRFDDPRFGIYYPIQNPILSERDNL